MYNEYTDIDFPEYGRQCNLVKPWRGYERATIIGKNGYRFIIQLSSGYEMEVYPDEIYFD